MLIEHFEDGRYDEPDVRAVLRRVDAAAWPEREMDLAAHLGADVTVTLTGGRVLSRSVARPLGRGPSVPLPADLPRVKFIDCARRALPAEAAERLHGMLDELESLGQVRRLTEAAMAREPAYAGA